MFVAPIVLEPGESLLAQVFANLFRGWEGVGGKLYVTDRRIRFESHAINVATGPTEIRLGKIVSALPCKTMWVIPNGLRIKTADGESYRFVIWNPRRIAALIQERQSDQDGHPAHFG